MITRTTFYAFISLVFVLCFIYNFTSAFIFGVATDTTNMINTAFSNSSLIVVAFFITGIFILAYGFRQRSAIQIGITLLIVLFMLNTMKSVLSAVSDTNTTMTPITAVNVTSLTTMTELIPIIVLALIGGLSIFYLMSFMGRDY